MSDRRALMLACLVLLIALCARLVPLQNSELPYNIDGFPLARISEIMVETGDFPDPEGYSGLLSYNMKLPVFSMMLAIFSLVLGMEPLTLLPYFCAVIGSLSAVFIFALARRLTESDLAAFSAGLFAALTGLFVYVTTAAMKQLLAIVLLCFILYLYPMRRDWRCRIAMAAALALLPFTHHLTSLIAMLILSFALAGTAFRRSAPHVRTLRDFFLDVALGPCILLLALVYYRAVNLEIASEVMNANDAVLLGSVALILAVAARMVSMTAQTKPWFFMKGEGNRVTFWHIFDEKVLVLAIGIAALYLNSRVHLFTGARMTSDTLLRLMLPYLLLAILALVGFNVLRYSKFPRRHLIAGMFLAPLCIMVFSALRDLDVFGFMVAYRSYNFMDIPLAICAGLGLAYVVGQLSAQARKHSFFRPLPAFALVIFVILCAMSLPLAYNSQDAFGVQEVTAEHEMAAMNWTAANRIGPVLTDQRLGDIAEPYFGIDSDKTGPWKIHAGLVTNGTWVMASQDWTVHGAQMYPLDSVTFSREAMSSFLETCNVCYAGGPKNNMVFVAVAN